MVQFINAQYINDKRIDLFIQKNIAQNIMFDKEKYIEIYTNGFIYPPDDGI